MILLVVIAVAWVVILGPGLLRRRQNGTTGINSISHFHHQLRVLEHSSPPPIVAPAYRLQAVGDRPVAVVQDDPESPPRPVLSVVGAKDLPRPALAFLGDDDPPGRDPRSRPDRAGRPGGRPAVRADAQAESAARPRTAPVRSPAACRSIGR